MDSRSFFARHTPAIQHGVVRADNPTGLRKQALSPLDQSTSMALSTRSSCLRSTRASCGVRSNQTTRTATLCAAASRSGRQLPVMSRISYAIEHAALVQKFELIAARSAMLGFAATILFELDGTRIVALGPSEGEMFAASSLLAMAASASLALARNRRAGGGLLLEGVLSSLTCVGRSASSLTSITPASLDASVDLIMETAFDEELTAWLQISLDEQERAVEAAAAAPTAAPAASQ